MVTHDILAAIIIVNIVISLWNIFTLRRTQAMMILLLAKLGIKE